ncbi:T9SS type A sorting domain-containing protein, partial [bacterium]|nr:T9SS type A sorting domain-containing protein [bacterium]
RILLEAYPNPFNPTTTIKYELPERADVRLSIYDIQGHNIQNLVFETQQAGHYETQWDGTNNQGKQVSAGMYFARLQAGEYSSVVKMVYL